MNNLIPISYDSVNPTVSGRNLHEALNVATPYKDWFPRMCEYGFKEGKDFSSNMRESTGGRPSTDHAVTITMAKELCMLQRSEMGRKFRQYFISVEEAWNSPEKVMERALQIAHQRAIEAERRILALAETNETLEIALNSSLQFYTVAKYNKVFHKNWSLTECQLIGKQLSAYCRSRAIEIRACETNDERFGAVNSYPITAWEDFLEVLQ
ncbi:antA/AntB antirepressor family protein [Dehalobacter sp.]|uniref:antA/AntB antirepressor family protein n=1 Tax=Dehalobacter sp. TaxID=1962289 RepID=UPI00258661F7|nr:antA/AntB antirepressor family protein [Dehalobacter sp.]MCG1024523.1 antA/AntB antirepressor family protein [Dehalobacter sp.]